jgi:uncharacterized Zn finger protein
MEPTGDAYRGRHLVICDVCGRDFVVAVAGEEHGEIDWWLTLRCGECGTVTDVIASEAEVDRYFDEFTATVERLETQAIGLARERMADEVSCLVTALRLDLIGWDDFTR